MRGCCVRIEPGARNAGRAWIPGGGVVDGFWAESGFPVFWGCASRAFPFLSVSSDLRADLDIRPESAHQFL